MRWGCGFIRPDRSDNTLKFEVRNVRHLVERVLPHFRAYPILSAKKEDVALFEEICVRIFAGDHRTIEGFSALVKVAMRMNASGKRKYSEDEILSSLRSGEGIVCARGKPRESREVPTCTNGVTTSPLSQPGTQRN